MVCGVVIGFDLCVYSFGVLVFAFVWVEFGLPSVRFCGCLWLLIVFGLVWFAALRCDVVDFDCFWFSVRAAVWALARVVWLGCLFQALDFARGGCFERCLRFSGVLVVCAAFVVGV